MSRKSRSSFLEEGVRLLVEYFGVDKVRAALAKVSNGGLATSERQGDRRSTESSRQPTPSMTSMLEQLRLNDEQKHHLLADFYAHLKDRKVLPESQDIRHFAQLIGLKEIGGKSRKDMLPRLMRFLLDQPTERLKADIDTAGSVSEQQRQQGFSVLTDKLMGDKDLKRGTS